MTNAVVNCCPTCWSTDPNVCSTRCYNNWHRGTVVHLQREPAGTPGSECSAACRAPVDDPPSQLAVDREFVTCAQCCSQMVDQRMIVARHQELSDEDIEHAPLDEMRAAYRSLRDHHVAETTALVERRDDLTRHRDEQLTRNQQVLAESQKLIERADTIMISDQETIDRLGTQNAKLVEIIDFMTNRYSPIGGRSCALCVYVDGRFVRPCALHRWDNTAAKVLASRATDPDELLTGRNLFDSANTADPATLDHLSDEELAAWADRVGVYREPLEGTYLRMILDELRERRDAEAIFTEADRQFQEVACRTCDDEGADNCEAHKLLVRQWRSARAALCDLARIHRGYLRSLNAPNGGDP